MQTEIEAKFPGVDAEALRGNLVEVGAKLEYQEVLMRRKNYDYPDGRLDVVGGWVRVRDEGDKITMSYKQLQDRSLHGTKEVNVIVDSFERACALIEAIGMVVKAYQETKREKWIFGDVEVTIDTWPWIPTFVELEGPTEASVRDCAAKLGFDWKNAMHGSIETVYQMHYDVTEEEVNHWKEIMFTPTPEWLLAKRK
jgi:adenylate cyclase, class 2